MGWGEEAKRLVFSMHDRAMLEKAIVQKVVTEHRVDDKTVRRCITGLDLIKTGEGAPTEVKERFERLRGTDRYLQEVQRAYWAYTHPPSAVRFTFSVREVKLIDAVDQLFVQRQKNSTEVYADIHLVTTRPIRLDGAGMNVSGQRVNGHFILQGNEMIETGEYLAVFSIPPGLGLEDNKVDVVIYANGNEFHSANQEQLTIRKAQAANSGQPPSTDTNYLLGS